MGPGPTDPVGSHMRSANLLQINTIPATAPSRDLLRRIIEHEKDGMPLVITGVDGNSHWDSQFSPVLGDNTPVDRRTADPSRDDGASALLPWLEALSFIPAHLLSLAEGTGFPQVIKDLRCERDGRGRPFQQNHCGSILQHLTLDLPDGSSDIWFASTASFIQGVENYLPTPSNELSPTFLMESELSSCPFPIYTHRQSAGDLLILPPSCYGQNLREGEPRSISWSRVTLHSLELSIYRDLPMYRRYCRPERYEIRQTIHAALVSRTTAVNQFVLHPEDATSSQEYPLSGMAQDLNTLVRLFDEILQEEYCNDHGSLDSAEIQRGYSTCNFCGSCLFLSALLCNGCSQETTRPVLVCAGCYVEGRSCRCGIMSPVRIGDFPGALRDRNNAASSLFKTSHLHHVPADGLVEVSESSFVWPKIAIFEAARELRRLKNAPDAEKKGKTCTPRGGEPSHPAPSISLLNCKKCHAAKCFLHILQGFVHISEALLAAAVGPGSAVWHERHQEARKRKGLPVASLSRVLELDALGRRVFFAQHFSSTSPLNRRMRLGFYDGPIQDTLSPPAVSPPDHGEIASIDPPVSRPPVSIPLSRTSSRSTVTLATDTESPVVMDRRTRQAAEEPIGISGPIPGSSRRNPKRARGDGGDGSDDDDDEYLPRKRARLARSTTRSIRAASTSSAVAGTSGQPLQPTAQSKLTSDRGPDQPDVTQSAPRRRPTRTASVQSSLSRTPSVIAHPQVVDPPAWKYFNPSLDMEVTVRPTEPTGESPPSANATFTGDSETVRGRGLPRGTFPQSSFVGLQSLFPRGSFGGTDSMPLHELPQAEGSSSSSNTPSAVVNSGPQEPTATGSPQVYQQSPQMQLRRQNSAIQPLTNPTNTSTATLRRWRDSSEDLEAQRVLETIQGDSLSRENLEAYVDSLRKFGALGK